MKILIVSQYFYPEEFKVNDLVAELVKRGHEVTVLTGKPNYPKGEYFSGYRHSGKCYENFCGASVIRVPLRKRGRGGGLSLILNYLSWIFHSCVYVLTHKIEADTVFAFGTSPIFQAYPGIIAKKQNKCRLSLWYQDLWPESVSATTGLKNKLILSVLNKMVKGVYKQCDTILVQSPAFSKSIESRGDFKDKIVFAPNWAEELFINPEIDEKKYMDLIPKGFVVMYAGNIGEAQDIESIVNAASFTSHRKDIHWVFLGDGRKRAFAEKMVEDKQLGDTASFLGRYPVTEMPSFFVHADAMIVSLKNEHLFSLTIPSRVQAYMAFGKPIVTMLSGIGNDIVKGAGCGYIAESGDYKTLANNVIKLADTDKRQREQIGERGKIYYASNFSMKSVVDTIESRL